MNNIQQIQPPSPPNPALLTDQNLYLLCKTYGARVLEWRRKFIGLLPEVNRRRLFEKKGFESIFVFAKKLAGLSEEQVRRALNLEKRFSTMPKLQSLLINGEVSVNKLARVASIANTENQEFLAANLKILSKGAVETLVRDEKLARAETLDIFQNKVSHLENQNGLDKAQIEVKSVPGHGFLQSNSAESSCQITDQNLDHVVKVSPQTGTYDVQGSTGLTQSQATTKPTHVQTLNLSPEVHAKLLELQQKGLDLNRLLLEFLQKRETEIAQKKEEISRKVLQSEEEKAQKTAVIQEFSLEPISEQSRYIPRPVRKIIREEHGTKCAIKSCQKPAENIHHSLPFSMSQSHDPKFLIPLCREHHELQHAINWRYQKSRAEIMAHAP